MFKYTNVISCAIVGLMLCAASAKAEDAAKPMMEGKPHMEKGEMMMKHRKGGESMEKRFEERIARIKEKYEERVKKINESKLPDEIKAKLKQQAAEVRDEKIKTATEIDKVFNASKERMDALRAKHDKELKALKEKYKDAKVEAEDDDSERHEGGFLERFKKNKPEPPKDK